MTKKELQVKESSEVSADVIDFSADVGVGLENADKASFAIPFLTILQGLSPQLETIDGAKPGMFVDTISNELFSELLVIPCAFQRRFVQWAPREDGGGFKGDHHALDVELNKIQYEKIDGKLFVGKDELKDTRNHFVLYKAGDSGWKPAMISLGSTQIKKSKRWMSRIQGVELKDSKGKSYCPASFSHIYKVKAEKESNSKGSWWGFDIRLDGQVTDLELYAKAKDFNKKFNEGVLDVSEPQSDAPVSENF